MADRLATLYGAVQSVFTVGEIGLFWQEPDRNRLRSALSYYASNNDLIRLRKGIYATTDDYDPLELAGRIFTPSYISLETVLTRAGVIFQYREEITVVSYLTRRIECDGSRFRFRKLKDSLLYDPYGVESRRSTPVVSMATSERAIADLVYLDGPRDLGNPDAIDWDKALAIARRTGNQRLWKDVNDYADRYSSAPNPS